MQKMPAMWVKQFSVDYNLFTCLVNTGNGSLTKNRQVIPEIKNFINTFGSQICNVAIL